MTRRVRHSVSSAAAIVAVCALSAATAEKTAIPAVYP